MPLSLVVGPPNSGRAGVIRARLQDSAQSDPVLVVPTRDDADRFEQELASEGAAFGVSILLFDGLFEAVAAATGAGGASPLTEPQRLGVVRAAISAADLGPLASSARRRGFAPAVADLISDIGASTLDPATIAANAAESRDPYLAGVAAINGAYAERLGELGRADSHGLARAATDALRADPKAWGERPAFLYGFDDLSVEQRELVAALSDATEVTATVTYEDRDAFAARAALREQLRALGGEETAAEARPEYTDSPLLFHLDRHFLEQGAERVAADRDEGLVLLEAAGPRAQAEQVAEEIAGLIAAGVAPDEIAVALRNVDRDGPLYDSVFESFGVPTATHANLPLAATATGRALLLALRASGETATAADLVAYLRGPGRAFPDQVDWLERRVRRGRVATAAEALKLWKGRDLFELAELREAPAEELLQRAARLATRIAEYPDERMAPHPTARRRLELRAGAAAARALAELAELEISENPRAEAIATLEELRLPLWSGASPGRVTIATPYRLRAGRFSHVFIAPLQLGEFPRPGRTDAMLGDEQRAALGLPKRSEPELEERYLFAVCLSLPTERLYLCWQPSDEDGGAAVRSPFIDEVLELVEGEPRAHSRPLANPALAPADPGEFSERFAGAQARVFLPGPITAEPVLAELGARNLFGASTLEGFRVCSYRWFVDHELRPQALDPAPEAMTMGSAVHRALELIYKLPPTLEPRPSPATLEDWNARARELIAEAAEEMGLAGSSPSSVAARVRAEQQVLTFIARDAGLQTPLVPVAEMIEASFGERDDDNKPPLEMEGFSLHGKIDRVDVGGPDGGERALLRDYKTSRQVTRAAKLEEEGKLQLQLYSIAVRELWGIDPAGALYEPLGATADHRPRGIAHADEKHMLGGLGLYDKDILDPEQFEEAIARAGDLAAEIVGRMRGGDITRDPLEDSCPKWCEFAPICRRERARPAPEDEDDEDEEEMAA